MANEITRLLPFRQYDENDVINFYSLDAETGEAGSVVRVSSANLDDEPIKYVERTDSNSWDATLGHGLSLYPEVTYEVTKCTGTGATQRPLGIMLRDVRAKDENGENLLYYPRKKAELQCVVSGEAVPVLTRGLLTVNTRALAGGVAPAINSLAICEVNGTLTGVAHDSATSVQKHVEVGKFIATGQRVSSTTTDAFAGSYAILKLEL
jgi:hypothetical protein